MRRLLLSLSLCAAPLAAQTIDNTAPETAPSGRNTGEPKVERIVVDGDNARIEELRVRGRTLRIVVTPKSTIAGFGGRYEILTGDGSSDLSHDPTSSRGAAGQRVWHLMRF